jgi:Nucleotidyltransferase domain
LTLHGPKARLAARIAAELFVEPNVVAVLVTGSVARGIDSEGSDLDLLVVLKAKDSSPRHDYATVDGVKVGTDRRTVKELKSRTAAGRGISFMPDLRELSRIAHAVVLRSRFKGLPEIQKAAAQAILHPYEATALFDAAANSLMPERYHVYRSMADRVWMLQGAADSLSMLALSLTPIRYQKPKWVIRDLKNSEFSTLLGALREAFSVAGAGARRASYFLKEMHGFIEAGARMARLPKLTDDDIGVTYYGYVMQTAEDAQNLLRDGDFEGAAYTAFAALRLMAAMLEDQSLLGAGVPPPGDKVARWRRETVRAVRKADALKASDLEPVRLALKASGVDLQRRYAELYTARGIPVEAPAQPP